jgi:hypothetical protein
VAGRLEWLGVHVVAVARRHEERVAIVKWAGDFLLCCRWSTGSTWLCCAWFGPMLPVTCWPLADLVPHVMARRADACRRIFTATGGNQIPTLCAHVPRPPCPTCDTRRTPSAYGRAGTRSGGTNLLDRVLGALPADLPDPLSL